MNKSKLKVGIVGAVIGSLTLMTGCLPDLSLYTAGNKVPTVPNAEDIQAYNEMMANGLQISGITSGSEIEQQFLQGLLDSNCAEYSGYVPASYNDEYVCFDTYTYFGYRYMPCPWIAFGDPNETDEAINNMESINSEIASIYSDIMQQYFNLTFDSVDTTWVEAVPYVFETNDYISIVITKQAILGGSMDFEATNCNQSEAFYFDKNNNVALTIEDIENDFAIDCQTQLEEAKQCYSDKLAAEGKDATNINEVNHFYFIDNSEVTETYYYFECNGEYEYVLCIPQATGSYVYECCGNRIKNPEKYNGGIVYICGNDNFKDAISGTGEIY